jgi:hypothetical protein
VAALIVTLTALFLSAPILYAQAHDVCRQSFCNTPALTPVQLRSLHRSALSLDAYGISVVAVNLIFGLVYCAIASLIFVRRAEERMALLSSFFLMIFGGLTFPGTPTTLAAQYGILHVPAGLTILLGAALLALFFFLFPSGRFVPSWSRWLVPVLPILQAPDALFPNSAFTLERMPALFGIVPFFTVLAAIVGAQVYRFRKVSTPIERQQTKWVVLGVGTGMTGFIILAFANVVLPPSFAASIYAVIIPQIVLYGFMLLIPLSIGLAVLRYNLWEADALINRTLVYGSLTLSLAALYLLGVVGLQALFRTVTGQSSDLAIAIVTLAIAALFNPWRRRLQSFIDQRFYRRKYDAARILAVFNSRLRDEVDLRRLESDILTVVGETVHPDRAALWLPEESRP